MLNQLDIYLKNADISSLYSDLGIKLHGFIMSVIDPTYADILHVQEPRPFSLFVYNGGNGFACRVSTLTDEAAQILGVLEKQEKIVVYSGKKPILLEVEHISRAAPIHARDIPGLLSGNRFTLEIAAPATRRTNGKYTNPPDLCKYFTSAAKKLQAYENILIEQSELEPLFADIKLTRYIFESREYLLGGQSIPAMTGRFEISVGGEHAEKIKLLLGYATYGGIGAKTPLGMGGFLVRA